MPSPDEAVTPSFASPLVGEGDRASEPTGEAPGVVVGLLAWRGPSDHPCDSPDAELIADGLGGRYSIYVEPGGGFLLWWAHDEFTWAAFPTIDDAKQAAQHDFETRIRAIVSVTA